MSVLNEAHFKDEAAAYAFVEARVWPKGRICPHCGVVDQSGALKGKSTRPGVYKCYACRKPFTVKVGTIFEKSHVPMHIWLQAMYLLCSSKKGISSNQLSRILGITLKSAWFVSHRIRKAMEPDTSEPMGGAGKIVEADETYFQKDKIKPKAPGSGGYAHKLAIVSIAERGGAVRSAQMKDVIRYGIRRRLHRDVHPDSTLHTDGAQYYKNLPDVAKHESVDHSKEYVRYGDEGPVHTNSLEGFFSVFKRGMRGVYQHCDEKHLDRYLAEFDFRHSNRVALGIGDKARTVHALQGVAGKRLTFKELIA